MIAIWDWIVSTIQGASWKQCQFALPQAIIEFSGKDRVPAQYVFMYCQRHRGHWGKCRTGEDERFDGAASTRTHGVKDG